MQNSSSENLVNQLITICETFGKRQWCLATGGNFSARLDAEHFIITQSGRDKSQLCPDDFMPCTAQGIAVDSTLKPSDETPLHAALYKHDADIGAVFHTHSVAATVLSRQADSELLIQGFEMQKALTGNTSHTDQIRLPVFDNNQDISELAEAVIPELSTQPGFLVRGHGLYAWGTTPQQAKRHVEGFEFLFDCLLKERLLNI